MNHCRSGFGPAQLCSAQTALHPCPAPGFLAALTGAGGDLGALGDLHAAGLWRISPVLHWPDSAAAMGGVNHMQGGACVLVPAAAIDRTTSGPWRSPSCGSTLQRPGLAGGARAACSRTGAGRCRNRRFRCPASSRARTRGRRGWHRSSRPSTPAASPTARPTPCEASSCCAGLAAEVAALPGAAALAGLDLGPLCAPLAAVARWTLGRARATIRS